MGKQDLAMEDYTRAIEINPALVVAYTNRGVLYIQQEDYEQAILQFSRAIELDKTLALNFSGRAYALYQLGRYEEAVENYNRSVEIWPAQFDSYLQMGQAYHALGEYERAIAAYERAIELLAQYQGMPEVSYAYYLKGQSHYALGQYQQAVIEYEQAIKTDIYQQNRWIYVYMGEAYEKLGQEKEASRSYATAAQYGYPRQFTISLRFSSGPSIAEPRLPFRPTPENGSDNG
jgi:tetratricopeptide (TPR) repeat protein